MNQSPSGLPELPALDPEVLAQQSPQDLARAMTAVSGTLGERLGIVLSYASPEKVVGTLPVEGNRQPAGRLHGGASIALAEELASIGSWLNLDTRKQVAVGVDISATHVRAGVSGVVTGEATIVYKGRTLMVWQVELKDEQGKTTTLARCTCNIIAR